MLHYYFQTSSKCTTNLPSVIYNSLVVVFAVTCSAKINTLHALLDQSVGMKLLTVATLRHHHTYTITALLVHTL